MDRVSIQQKIDNWLRSNHSYAAKSPEEIISAMVAANALTLSEAEEISVFGLNTLKEEPSVMPSVKPQKSKEELLEALEIRLVSLALQVEQVEKDNSLVESAWSWIKDKTGFGDSLSKVKDALQKDMELFDKLKNSEHIDLKEDDFPYNAEEIDQLLEGQIELKSQTALNNYKEGQEMASDMFGDLTSGIGAVCLYSAITLTGGAAAIPLAIGGAILAGGTIKAGTKALDNLGSEQKYNTFSKDLLTGGFSGLLAPVTAGLGGVAGKFVAKTLGVAGVKATKILGKTAIESSAESSFKQIAKNALLNPTGYQYKGGLAWVASGTEMGVDGMLGGGIDGAYRAALEGQDIGDAFIAGSLGGLVLSPAIGGGFKLAGKGASKIAQKIWESNAPTPPLTTPNKYEIQTPKVSQIKISELGDEAKSLHETLKEHTLFNHKYLLRLCLDENGNVIPEARDRVLELLTDTPQIAELFCNNLNFCSLEDVNKVAQMAKKCMAEQYQSPRGLSAALDSAMDDNGYVDSFLLDKLYQIYQNSVSDMDSFQEILTVANVKGEDGRHYIDLNVLDAINDGVSIDAVKISKDVNGVFQKGNLEGYNYIRFLLDKRLYSPLSEVAFNACKNEEGIVYYPKLQKYTEILKSGKFNMEDTASMIMPLIFNAKNEFQPNVCKKLIKEFDESFTRNNYSTLKPIITDFYKSGDDVEVERLLNRLAKFKGTDCGLLIEPLSKMPDEEFNKLISMIDERFTPDMISKSVDFLSTIIEKGKFNEELANKGMNYWRQGVHPERLGWYISVLKTEYAGVTLEDKNRFINKLLIGINPGFRKQLDSTDSLRVIRLYKSILERRTPEYTDIALDLANKKVPICVIEDVLDVIYNYPVDKAELLKRVEYLSEKDFGNCTLDVLKAFSDGFKTFDDIGLERCVKLRERGCDPKYITSYLGSNKEPLFDTLEEFEKAVFAKRNILKSGTEDLSDDDLFKFIYKKSPHGIYGFLNDFELPVLEASFGLKLDGVDDFLERYIFSFKDSLGEANAEFLLALNPKKALQPELTKIQKKIKALKSSYKDVAASGDKEALECLKKQINDATTQERKIQSYIKEATLEPLETINKIRTLMAFKTEPELRELIALIKPNIASDEMIETIKKDPAIMQAFENRANKNQDLKVWYSHNVLKPHNDAIWNETINRKIYKKLDIEYDEELAQKLQLQKSKYLPEILSSDRSFVYSFKDLISVLQANPALSVKDALDNLEQNIATRNEFKKLGIDYDKWTTVDKNHFKAIRVELDAEEAKSAAIKNLEEDLSDVSFNTLPQSELKKIFADLENIGVTLKEVKELAYDADGYPLPAKTVQKLYKDGNPIEFKDLAQIISTIKSSMNSNQFWTREHPDALINDIKNTMYNHIMKLRDSEIKNAINLKGNQVSNLEVHQVDMNDISHALFLGNHGHCCTAVGTGINQFSAPNYIMNKCIQGIEIMDGEQFVGNTMCYIAKVDGKTSLVLDNIEVAQRYQDNDQIRDAFMEYARELCKRIGQPNMPIYAGPYRHKFDMNVYKQSDRMVEIKGFSGGQDVYIDYLTDGREIDNRMKDRVKLFRIS